MTQRETLIVTNRAGTLFAENVDPACRFCSWLRLRCESWHPAWQHREFKCVACGAFYLWERTG